MLSDKLELNSVRALGRLELTSWEHIPGWAEIQPLLGKTCESMASPAVVAGGARQLSSHSRLVGWSQDVLEGQAVSLDGYGLGERMEAQQGHF